MIISIHIPKTAGTSFKLMMLSEFEDDFLIVYPCDKCGKFVVGYNQDEFEFHEELPCAKHFTSQELISYILNYKFEFIHGHIKYSEIADIENYQADVKYIFWLRDPVQRYVSHYMHSFRKGFVSEEETAELFFEKIGTVISDYISGIPIRKVLFFGFQETFAEDLKTLYKILGREQGEVLFENYAPEKSNVFQRHELDTDTENKLNSLLRKDISLYNNYRKMHERQYSC